MSDLPVEVVGLDKLKGHPRNYRVHTLAELDHLAASIGAHGLYRNVVVASDYTILAGHGVVMAAQRLGLTDIEVVRMDYGPDDPRAYKLLLGDNELAHLVEADDRKLSELLREMREGSLDGLMGTGWDDEALANLVLITRPETEVEDLNAAAALVGATFSGPADPGYALVVTFFNEADRREFARLVGATPQDETRRVWRLAAGGDHAAGS